MKITELADNEVFVFGSNLAARHGAGAALDAKRYFGASSDVAIGVCGQSYAIPTKDANLKPLPLDVIRKHIWDFAAHAEARPNIRYIVTKVGCGLAGYKVEEIAPLFYGASRLANVELPTEFQECIDAIWWK